MRLEKSAVFSALCQHARFLTSKAGFFSLAPPERSRTCVALLAGRSVIDGRCRSQNDTEGGSNQRVGNKQSGASHARTFLLTRCHKNSLDFSAEQSVA
jgi:hypothetical protein